VAACLACAWGTRRGPGCWLQALEQPLEFGSRAQTVEIRVLANLIDVSKTSADCLVENRQCRLGFDARLERREPFAQLIGRRMHDDVDLCWRVAAELGEHLCDAARVVLGVAQVGLTRAAGVRADHDRVGRDPVVGTRAGARE